MCNRKLLMSNQFVADYIQSCLSKGVNSPTDMRNMAIEELKKVTEELAKKDALKTRQSNLNAVVRNLGGGSHNQEPEPRPNFSVPEDQITSEFRTLLIEVCKAVQRSDTSAVRSGDLVDELSIKLGILPQNRSSINLAIKWLGVRRIIDRNDDRMLILGSKWRNRPNNEN